MTFYYSSLKLRRHFLIRFAPSIVFLLLALLFGFEFWIVVFVLWAEAVAEVWIMKKRGYFKIEETFIRNRSLFNPIKIKFEEIRQIFTYDGEWTFRARTKELRLQLRNIREDQRAEFMEAQERIRKQRKDEAA